jgi:antitoxin component of MazEF toxin-antitoxin module
MRALQKLVRNGNSTQVTLPRTLLHYLGWLPGENIIVECTDAKHIVIRRPDADDFAPKRAVSVLLDATLPGTR